MKKIPQACPPSPHKPVSVAEMRTPSQLLLVLFAVSVVVDAYAVPKGAECPPFATNSSTTTPLAGDKHRGDDDLAAGFR